MICNNTKLQVAMNDAMGILDSLGIKYGRVVELEINTRAKSRWGQCKKVRGGYSINISQALLSDDSNYKALMDTVIHELLHTCKDCMNHGELWKRYARKVNSVYGYNIQRCTSAEEKGINLDRNVNYKYEITCLGCGLVTKYQREGAVVQQLKRKAINSSCTCVKCGSRSFTVRKLGV